MKRFLVILLVALTISCDDGAITLESFNFDSATIKTCNASTNKEFLFKINEKELLLLDIPASTFTNTETAENEPIVLTINTTNKAYYRLYNSTLVDNTICALLPPASPTVVNEWVATGGTIEITIRKKYNTTTPTTVDGYNNFIIFKNISFGSVENTFSFEEYNFGTYYIAL